MKNGEHDILIIDEYLNSEMSPEKMREIEERIGSDPRFAKKLKEVRILRTGIIRVGLKEKIDRMKELDKELSSDEELERMVKDPHYVVEDPLQMQNSQPVNGKSAKRIQLPKRNHLRKWMSIAAGLLILVVFGVWQTSQFNSRSEGVIMADNLWMELDYASSKGSNVTTIGEARELLQLKKTREAFDLLMTQVENENDPAAIHYAILAGLKLDELDKVEELFSKAIKIEALDNNVTKYYRVLLFLKRNDFEGAQKFIKQNNLEDELYPLDWGEMLESFPKK